SFGDSSECWRLLWLRLSLPRPSFPAAASLAGAALCQSMGSCVPQVRLSSRGSQQVSNPGDPQLCLSCEWGALLPLIACFGPKTKVVEGVSLVEQILSGLHFKRVVIDLPGAKAYIKEQAPLLAVNIKEMYKCLVLLEEQPEEHSNRGKLHMQVTMGETVIALYKADLCTHPVDVVVNASNEDLKHIGGLAEALSRAAGPALQEECDELVRRLGNLQPGDAVMTHAGKLPCKNVIHAVGPRWSSDRPEICVNLLRKTVKRCLQLAEMHKHRSIALPAISGGIFGFPMELCTYSICCASCCGTCVVPEKHTCKGKRLFICLIFSGIYSVFNATFPLK
uniref:Macro domain-containing protein n=1 Tax=Junco hyemalis TaxID=40217 RepID=A0A8C5JWR6_JUNHY